jgi:hypothetical protein
MPDASSDSSIKAQVSLIELIDRGGFEASIITTFSANLPFYEEFVLRRLQAKNCRQNFVLMDAAQCASAWRSEASRPRYAGVEYTLIPMHAEGAFHPKIVVYWDLRKLPFLLGATILRCRGLASIERSLASSNSQMRIRRMRSSFEPCGSNSRAGYRMKLSTPC